MSKLYSGLLVVASLFVLAALGTLILILITDLAKLVMSSPSGGMG